MGRSCTLAAILWLSLVPSGFSYDYSRDKEWLHSNITSWISFGPAIIGTCKRIDLHVEDIGDFKLLASDANFPSVKNWVQTSFENKLDMSPNDTVFQSIRRKAYLVLYSNDKGERNDTLLVIPLSARMLNTSERDFLNQLNDLKAKMTPQRLFLKGKAVGSQDTMMLVLPANAIWTDTKLALDDVFNKSVSISVDAGEHWGMGNGPDCDAGGFPTKVAPEGYAEPGAPIGCLVGRIGRKEPFMIGKSIRSLPRGVGELFLTANDDVSRKGFSNNHGTIHVKILYPPDRQ
jgi:hypothetical protein